MNGFIFFTLVCYTFTALSIMFFMIARYGHCFFNPIENYEEWDKLNIFGIGFFTLLINIAFAPFTICYWIYKILKFLFTAGRR